MQSTVKIVPSLEEFNTILQIKDRLIVVDIYASWCGPCMQLGKILHQLVDTENKFPTVIFLKIDVDNDDFAQFLDEQKVSGIPRLFCFKNNKKIFDMTGFNPAKLLELLNHIDSNK